MSKKVMINCDEATTLCDKSQYCEATFWDKIRLQMHLFLCKRCGLYSEQNKVMTRIFNIHLCREDKKLADSDKENIKMELEKQMK